MVIFLRRTMASIEISVVTCCVRLAPEKCPAVVGIERRDCGNATIVRPVFFLLLTGLLALSVSRTLSAESPFLQSWEQEGRLNLVRVLNGPLADWFYAHPVYRDLYEAGSDTGGDRDEYRDQNRARNLSLRGLDLALYNPQWTGGLRLTARSLSDYHYYRSDSDRWDSYTAAGEVFAYLHWRPGASDANSGDPAPDTSALLPAVDTNEADTFRREGEPAAGLTLQGGRIALRTDPEGLLFVGEGPGGRLIYSGQAGGTNRARGVRLGVAGLQVNREIRAVGRPDHPAAVYFGTVGWLGDGWNLGALYGFYRSPGRAVISDQYLPGIPPTSVALPVGQSGLPDVDVHYYGLRLQQSFDAISYTLSAYSHAGRDIAVDAAGTRVGVTRRSIRGALGYGELVYHFNAASQVDGGQHSPGCLMPRPAGNSCLRATSLVRGPEFALAGLFGTRDANDGDDKLRGFGALRPAPAVMGGVASIFLNGPPLAGERPPLQNTQPGVAFADGGLPDTRIRYPDGLQPDGTGRARDNVDPTPPEFDNEGLAMGSLRFSFAPFAAPRNRIAFDLYANHARFRAGTGWEGIAAARLPFDFVDAQFALELSATGATYRGTEPEPDPITGADRQPPRKFYSRYRVGFVLSL